MILGLCLGTVCDPGLTDASAASTKPAKPGTPVIVGEQVYDDGDLLNIRVTISETSNASGYQIYLKSPGSTKFKKVKTLKKNGKQARECQIDCLEAGDYQVRVRAYHKKNKKTVKGDYSNTLNITLVPFGEATLKNTGENNTAAMEYAGEKYPLIREMTDNGLITLTSGNSSLDRDTIIFGSYIMEYYDDEDDDEDDDDRATAQDKESPLEWEVLKYSDDAKSALVISKNIITEGKFAEKAKKYSWEKSDIRKWLNEDFLNTAFTKEEQALIKTVEVSDLWQSGTKTTKDKIYLLSKDEAYSYMLFADEYPDNLAACLSDGIEYSWFLRDPYEKKNITVVSYDGVFGYTSPYREFGIRPVFWIELTPELISNNKLTCVRPAGNRPAEMDKIYVNLGKYDIPDSDGKGDGVEDSIEWEILDYDEEGGKALLLSRYLLCDELSEKKSDEEDDELFEKISDGEDDERVPWKDSYQRKWLRHVFYEQAFTDTEKALISQVTTGGIQQYSGIQDSPLDKVFALSEHEVYEFIAHYDEMDERVAYFGDGEPGEWNLRTTDGYDTYFVDIDGSVDHDDGQFITNIRPAIYLNLNAGNDTTPEPDAPDFTAKSTDDGAGIEINVERSWLADGYYIYLKESGKKKYKKVKTVAEDGSSRHVVLRNLKEGTYSVYVKAFRTVEGKELLSANNDPAELNLEGFSSASFAQDTYPKLKSLADKGLIGLKVNYEKDSIKLGKWVLPIFYAGENKQEDDLEWVVLDYSDDLKEALVISKYIVSMSQFNNKDKNVTWDNCSLRKWLNEDFINKAFSDEERSMIKVTKVKAEDNPREHTSGGSDTEDKLFLLSISEAEKYFCDENWNPFENGLKGYLDTDNDTIEWLRSPGRAPADMSHYWALDPEDRDEEDPDDWRNGYAAGYWGRDYWVETEGMAVVESWGVRPAFRIDLTPELIEANKLSLNKTERGHYSDVIVEFGSYVSPDPRNITGTAKTLTWKMSEYDEKNNKALLVCTSKVAKEAFENDFLKNSFTADERALVKEIFADEEDADGVRPAMWIELVK